ncbi:MAG: DsbA family protein [Alphaproteobacteria bacterium]|nr:DsbA family protein [Alphaproteobacteria bacterium]
MPLSSFRPGMRSALTLFAVTACITMQPALVKAQNAAAPAAKSTAESAKSSDPLSREDVRAIVRDVIAKEPQLIIESLTKAQQEEELAAQKKRDEQLKTRKKELTADPDSPVAGNPKGDVTIVEFYDYNCGYCKMQATTLKKAVEEDGNVRWVFKDMPILRPESAIAAKASIAAARQGKHLNLHMALMALKRPIDSETVIFETAEKAGLDVDRLKKDMADKAIGDALARSSKLAEDLGIRGTPFLIIGDKSFPGAVQESQLKAAIADARKKKP